jgi:hypothetical protein
MLGIDVIRNVLASGVLLRGSVRSQSIVVLTVSAKHSLDWPVRAYTDTRRWGMVGHISPHSKRTGYSACRSGSSVVMSFEF